MSCIPYDTDHATLSARSRDTETGISAHPPTWRALKQASIVVSLIANLRSAQWQCAQVLWLDGDDGCCTKARFHQTSTLHVNAHLVILIHRILGPPSPWSAGVLSYLRVLLSDENRRKALRHYAVLALQLPYIVS